MRFTYLKVTFILIWLILLPYLAASDFEDVCSAAQSNSASSLLELLDANPTWINKKCAHGQTPLMLASLAGSADVAKILLARGADTSIGEKDGYTPFHGAAFQGRVEVGKVLLEHGLSPIDFHKDGFTPFHRAAWGNTKGHTEFVKWLLDQGVDPELKSIDGRTALSMTSNKGTQKLLQKYIKKQKNQDDL